MRKLILFSGGMDSTVLLRRAYKEAKTMQERPVPLFVDYGQPHKSMEMNAAVKVSAHLGLALAVAEVNLSGVMKKGSSPVVPGRNLALIGVAINRAVVYGCGEVQLGCCAADVATFADCRREFIDSANDAARAYGVRVTAPLLHTTKREIRDELGRQLPNTWSCYHPNNGKPCGQCGACEARGNL
jgi:7-cyano-7-deazaguanine synthase